MSTTKTKAGADDAPAVDPRDAELEELRAQLAAAKEAAQQQPATADDAQARAMEALRAELAELKATPEGEAAELRRAFTALADQVTRMQTGAGLVPVPVAGAPDPHLYGVRLDCGDVLTAAHPHATHHHCAEHGTVPVSGHWNLSDEMRAAANA
jgi:hypothetical protein